MGTNYRGLDFRQPNLNNKNEILFAPVISKTLDYANAEYMGAKVGWKRENGKIRAYADIPENFNGRFVFGDVNKMLRTGYNDFII